MAEPIKASDYLALGECIYYSRNAANSQPAQYAEHVQKLVAQLTTCSFHSTAAAAMQFNGLTIPPDPISGRIGNPAHLQFSMIAETVSKVLYNEASNRQTLALDPNEVTKRLRDFPTHLPSGKTLTVAQTELLNETIRCIECGAYRAAAVMGWNLAYDYMRQWAFDTKLAELNAGFAKVCPKKKLPIVHYSDFFDKDAPNERNVIDAIANQDSGPIINGEVCDHLVQYLRYRNKYAHPTTEKSASAAKTNAYIEHLIDIISLPTFT